MFRFLEDNTKGKSRGLQVKGYLLCMPAERSHGKTLQRENRMWNWKCKKYHATALHYNTPDETQAKERHEVTARATNSCVSCQLNDCNGTTSSMIVPVSLYHQDKPDCKVQVYAVLDDQSDTCLSPTRYATTLVYLALRSFLSLVQCTQWKTWKLRRSKV